MAKQFMRSVLTALAALAIVACGGGGSGPTGPDDSGGGTDRHFLSTKSRQTRSVQQSTFNKDVHAMLVLEDVCHLMDESACVPPLTACREVPALARPIDVAVWCHDNALALQGKELTVVYFDLRIVDLVVKDGLCSRNLVSAKRSTAASRLMRRRRWAGRWRGLWRRGDHCYLPRPGPFVVLRRRRRIRPNAVGFAHGMQERQERLGRPRRVDGEPVKGQCGVRGWGRIRWVVARIPRTPRTVVHFVPAHVETGPVDPVDRVAEAVRVPIRPDPRSGRMEPIRAEEDTELWIEVSGM
jgi:hypothetical protein